MKSYAEATGVKVEGLSLHALRALDAANALEHEGDIAYMQKWPAHAQIATTSIYDRKQSRPEDSPTYGASY